MQPDLVDQPRPRARPGTVAPPMITTSLLLASSRARAMASAIPPVAIVNVAGCRTCSGTDEVTTTFGGASVCGPSAP